MINIRIAPSVKCSGIDSLFITFPYRQQLVDIVRKCPTRYWDKDNKCWEVPYQYLDEVVKRFEDANYTCTVVGKPTESSSNTTKPKTFEFKTKPFKHQLEGFDYGLKFDRWLLGDEQGLGKTKQVIDIAVAKKLQFGYEHCLIICGVNGLKWNWANEIATHSNEKAHILGQRKRKNKIVVGSTKDKLADLMNIDDIDAYFLITNVESFRTKEVAEQVKKLCDDGVIGIVAIDEMHAVKNPNSQQGKGVLKVQPKHRIAMTGTPLMNNPLDLYMILKWLGYEKHPFYKFKNHYCILGGYGGYEIVGYRNLSELSYQLDEIMLRRLKSDVLDLPDKLHINEYVEMSGKQAQIYKEVEMNIRANIDQIKMSPNPLAELIRLRQATGYTGILSSTIKESAKLERMIEIVEEAVNNNQKVVIFSNWLQMVDPILHAVKKYNPAIITGEVNADTRQKMVEKFQHDDSCKVIVGTIGAMGTGLTLTAGTVEIFMDEPWTMASKQQAEDRCHRVGTKENVTIYTLMCKNTIDERIHDIVENKGQMADILVDKKGGKSSVELLNFLLS